jgi:hypothetical protein
MPYLEHTVEFATGQTGNIAAIQRHIDPAFGALAWTALGAAQSEGGGYDDARPLVGYSDPEAYDRPVGAGHMTLGLLTKVAAFVRAAGVELFSLGPPGGIHTTQAVRQLGGAKRREVAEILGPARREQAVSSIHISWMQERDTFGPSLDAWAVHLAAPLDLQTPENDQLSFTTNVAMERPRGVRETLARPAGRHTLTVTVGNVHTDGSVRPDPRDRPPGFEYVHRWVKALALLTP